MAPRAKRPTQRDSQSEYPSLREHLASRRRFLGVAGASLAAGALQACNRSLGAPGDPDATTTPPDGTTPTPDATVPPPDTGPIPGGREFPDYYLIRVPATGDLSAHLLDNGYAQFYVEAATYDLDASNALTQNAVDAGEQCRQTVSEHTYDALNTAAGIAACEDDLLAALDELVMEMENHTTPTLEYVTLTISYLEPDADLGGAREAPSYP